MSTRTSIQVEQNYAIIRGLLCKGIALYGPFASLQEAIDYSEKNFPDDTREVLPIIKETIVHEQ